MIYTTWNDRKGYKKWLYLSINTRALYHVLHYCTTTNAIMQPNASEERLQIIEDDIQRCDREYKGLGIRYHQMSSDARELAQDSRRHFTVRVHGNSDMPRLPHIITAMDKITDKIHCYRRDRKDDQRFLAAIGDALARIWAMITQAKYEISHIIRLQQERWPAIDMPESRGFDRILAMGDPGSKQRDDFYAWAMELKEVKTAIRLGRLVESEVDEFISDEDDRFIIEDPPHTPQDEDNDEVKLASTRPFQEQDPDQMEVRRIFGPQAAVQLL